jgi:hypothetical protein
MCFGPDEDIFCALETMMEEKHRQDRNCLFRLNEYRNESQNPEKTVLGSSSGEFYFLYIENYLFFMIEYR